MTTTLRVYITIPNLPNNINPQDLTIHGKIHIGTEDGTYTTSTTDYHIDAISNPNPLPLSNKEIKPTNNSTAQKQNKRGE